jgi:predicted nucleic acid-binding protein
MNEDVNSICFVVLDSEMNNEFWMRDEKRKKKKKTKKETKRREKYYLAGRFLQRGRFHRLFHSEQAFHFS